MAKADVLDRVAADLARGHTHPAIQRLGSLVAAHPTDLDLRHRLAQLHRRVGDRVQAGRWDYLTPGASTAETAAFERAHPEPAARLRELHWPLRAGAAATEYARAGPTPFPGVIAPGVRGVAERPARRDGPLGHRWRTGPPTGYGAGCSAGRSGSSRSR